MSSTADNAEQTAAREQDAKLRTIVYSSNRLVREEVKLALGRKVATDLPEVEIFEFATQPALFEALDNEPFDVAVLDAEAVPGGMGIAHQMKEEIPNAAPVVLLVARRDDAWMAGWSRAEAISAYPIDPLRLPETVATVVRNRRSGARTALSSSFEFTPGQSSRHPGRDDDGHDVPTDPGTEHAPGRLA